MSELQPESGEQISNLIAGTCAAIDAALESLAVAGCVLQLPFCRKQLSASVTLLVIVVGVVVSALAACGGPPALPVTLRILCLKA